MHKMTKLALGLALALPLSTAVHAEGNLAANGAKLELKVDTTNNTFSQNEIDLETGKYYRLDITVDDGADDTALMMPEFFRNVWINQIVINDMEIKAQTPYSLEFDAAGTINLSFVPIRPGEYDFWIDGYQDKGLKGKFVVK